MTLSDLQTWLVDEEFGQELNLLSRLATLAELENVEADKSLSSIDGKIDWRNILAAGSILAKSDNRKFEEAALRIATAAVTLSSDQVINDAGAILFEKLSNRRAVNLAESRNDLRKGLMQRLGVTARLDASRRLIENSVLLGSTGEFLETNKFQRKFWTSASSTNGWVSASAPTASGKTYVVLRWLVDQLILTDAKVAIYLAPTRALVSEIEENLRRQIKASEASIEVTSLPLRSLQAESLKNDKKIIFVFTQERLHLFANVVGHEFQVQILIIDEAHKVGDRLRGVILQDAQERIARTNPHCRAIFLSPATQNPAILLEDVPDDVGKTAVDSDTPTVLQNIILATQVPRKPTEWHLQLRQSHDLQSLGILRLPNRPTTFAKRLAFISAAISPSGGTLIYANGASEAEEVAFLISQLVPRTVRTRTDGQLRDLADLARKGVHQQYQLAPLVELGIAFHYGNMPTLLRTEIERLFRAGIIKFLVCTSTLIEGVNLSCRNIVLRGPRKGKGQPMNAQDFWNLAGRAGRWGDEFQGNIICIDPQNAQAWPEGVPLRTRYPIKRETDEVIRKYDDLRAFIEGRLKADTNTLLKGSQFEQVSAYLISMYLREGSIRNVGLVKRHSSDELKALEAGISVVADNITIPADVCTRHPGVSAIGMQRLLNYFSEREAPIEELLPAPSESDDAYERLIRIMYRINANMYPAFMPMGLVPLHALVTIEWMRGLSLAAIIRSRIGHHKRKGEDFQLPKLIRDTMELVEQTARFRAPKYVAAYMDVLNLHLRSVGRDELADENTNFGLMLEFGLSTQTLISLMEIGLSRMSAVALYELMAQDNLSQGECIEWIRQNYSRLNGMEVPVVVLREIGEKITDLEADQSEEEPSS
jgi:hypothetical protein